MTGSEDNIQIDLWFDHSVVETFGQKGRSRITSRIYPDQTDATHVALRGDLTHPVSAESVSVWSVNTIWQD